MRRPVVEVPIRLLIADDQESARRGLSALLSTFEGMEVVGTAADGWEAVKLAESLRPDLIVMDGQMPNLGGIEATREIKDRHPEIAVVMHSFHAHLELAARLAGVDAFVLKGCPIERLVATVRQVLETIGT